MRQHNQNLENNETSTDSAQLILRHYDIIEKLIQLDEGHVAHCQDQALVARYETRLKSTQKLKGYYDLKYNDLLLGRKL